MPEITSFPDFMADWARLIKAVLNNQQSLPNLTGLLAPLEALLEEARDLEAHQGGRPGSPQPGGQAHPDPGS